MDEAEGRRIAGSATFRTSTTSRPPLRGGGRARLAWEDEPLAEALAIHRAQGDAGPLWIAERIGALATAGDAAGVRRFQAVAGAYTRLLDRTAQ